MYFFIYSVSGELSIYSRALNVNYELIVIFFITMFADIQISHCTNKRATSDPNSYTETIRFRQKEIKLIDCSRVIDMVIEHRSDASSVSFIIAGTGNVALISRASAYCTALVLLS